MREHVDALTTGSRRDLSNGTCTCGEAQQVFALLKEIFDYLGAINSKGIKSPKLIWRKYPSSPISNSSLFQIL